MLQHTKEIISKFIILSLCNQTLLSTGSKPIGTQRNEIWKTDVSHFEEFGKLKYIKHTIDSYPGFQCAAALSLEKVDSLITYLLVVLAIMVVHIQIKTHCAPACL